MNQQPQTEKQMGKRIVSNGAYAGIQRMFLGAWLLVLIVMPALAQTLVLSSKPKQTQPKVPRNLIVLETYVNYMVTKYSHPFLVSFLRVSKTIDGRKALVRQCARRKTPIMEVGSRVRYGAGHTDRRTGKAAIIYGVDAIKWIGDSKVEVRGGWSRGGRAGIGAIYTLVREKNVWRVSEERAYSES